MTKKSAARPSAPKKPAKGRASSRVSALRGRAEASLENTVSEVGKRVESAKERLQEAGEKLQHFGEDAMREAVKKLAPARRAIERVREQIAAPLGDIAANDRPREDDEDEDEREGRAASGIQEVDDEDVDELSDDDDGDDAPDDDDDDDGDEEEDNSFGRGSD